MGWLVSMLCSACTAWKSCRRHGKAKKPKKRGGRTGQVLNFCSGSQRNLHEGIVYDERVCPLCERLKEIGDLEDKVFELERQLWHNAIVPGALRGGP